MVLAVGTKSDLDQLRFGNCHHVCRCGHRDLQIMTEPSSEQEEPKKPEQAECKETPEGKLFALVDELPSPFGQDTGVTEGSWFYDNDR
jgi:hypothetical protein